MIDHAPCCTTWDANPLVAQTPLMHARRDGYPVAEGHALIIPRRHVVSLFDLTEVEFLGLRHLLREVRRLTPADGYTIGVNEGVAAGRTVPHLHVHVIPRHWGDVPDPRGGIRQVMLGANPDNDPWFARGAA